MKAAALLVFGLLALCAAPAEARVRLDALKAERERRQAARQGRPVSTERPSLFARVCSVCEHAKPPIRHKALTHKESFLSVFLPLVFLPATLTWKVWITLFFAVPQKHPAWLPGALQERFAALGLRTRVWAAREKLFNYLVQVSLPIVVAREISQPLLGRVYSRLWEMEMNSK